MSEGFWSVTEHQRRAADLVEKRWGALLAEINTDAETRDAAGSPVPEKFFAQAAETGLLALPLPPGIGDGMDLADWAAVLEHIGYLCRDSGFPLVLSFRAILAQALLESGRRDLVENYVVPVARGEIGLALAYSEDADALSFRTTLRTTAGGYVLDGHKDFMTGGGLAHVFLTYARTEAGDMAACLVHRDDPGVLVTALDPVGTRTSAPAALDLRAVPLAPERVVVGSDGLAHAQQLLNARRLIVCCAPVGRARALVELTAARVGSTMRNGQPVASLPNVQGTLGRMYIAVEAARAMLYRAAARPAGEADPIFDPLASAAKHFVVEQVRYVLEQAMRVLGGHFYYGDPYFGICMRDFAGLAAIAGTQDLLEVNLGALAGAYLTPRTPRKAL
jgi:alkylation response protein AidB-like acyl-CoA dehydrogenase